MELKYTLQYHANAMRQINSGHYADALVIFKGMLKHLDFYKKDIKDYDETVAYINEIIEAVKILEKNC